jgi:hypothetical protein
MIEGIKCRLTVFAYRKEISAIQPRIKDLLQAKQQLTIHTPVNSIGKRNAGDQSMFLHIITISSAFSLLARFCREKFIW